MLFFHISAVSIRLLIVRGRSLVVVVLSHVRAALSELLVTKIWMQQDEYNDRAPDTLTKSNAHYRNGPVSTDGRAHEWFLIVRIAI